MSETAFSNAEPIKKPSAINFHYLNYDWLTQLLLVILLFAAIIGSLCIGAFPMSFSQAGRIVLHLAWPFPLPDIPPWTLKERTRPSGAALRITEFWQSI